MKADSINLASTQVIPKEGYFKPNGSKFSIGLKSDDLSASTAGFTLKGAITTDGSVGFGTMQEAGADIAETLTSGVACVRTFEVDPALYYKIEFTGSETGTVYYEGEE